MLKIKVNEKNFIVLENKHAVLYYSYLNLVAVAKDGVKYRSNAYHSITTIRQLNKRGFKDAEKVSPEMLEKLAFNE